MRRFCCAWAAPFPYARSLRKILENNSPHPLLALVSLCENRHWMFCEKTIVRRPAYSTGNIVHQRLLKSQNARSNAHQTNVSSPPRPSALKDVYLCQVFTYCPYRQRHNSAAACLSRAGELRRRGASLPPTPTSPLLLGVPRGFPPWRGWGLGQGARSPLPQRESRGRRPLVGLPRPNLQIAAAALGRSISF